MSYPPELIHDEKMFTIDEQKLIDIVANIKMMLFRSDARLVVGVEGFKNRSRFLFKTYLLNVHVYCEKENVHHIAYKGVDNLFKSWYKVSKHGEINSKTVKKVDSFYGNEAVNKQFVKWLKKEGLCLS